MNTSGDTQLPRPAFGISVVPLAAEYPQIVGHVERFAPEGAPALRRALGRA